MIASLFELEQLQKVECGQKARPQQHQLLHRCGGELLAFQHTWSRIQYFDRHLKRGARCE